jgi:uncharacterized protein (TIGR03643 family)
MDIIRERIIKLAWHDETSFEEIKNKFEVSEGEIIKIMRYNLKPNSFKLWRKRVSGRISKHRKKNKFISKFKNYKIDFNEIY